MIKKISKSEIKKITNKGYFMSWEEFSLAGEKISEDIKNKFGESKKICLIGVARVALPLLTLVSHHTGIRNIAMFQAIMTKSDNPYDYGDVKSILGCIREDIDDYIILEDMVYKGNTINLVKEYLLKNNKNILAIYSLIKDEGFYDKEQRFVDYPIYYVYNIAKEKWNFYPWENIK
jgi:hypoxanthine-guanine phosphoribosyltransferase